MNEHIRLGTQLHDEIEKVQAPGITDRDKAYQLGSPSLIATRNSSYWQNRAAFWITRGAEYRAEISSLRWRVIAYRYLAMTGWLGVLAVAFSRAS